MRKVITFLIIGIFLISLVYATSVGTSDNDFTEGRVVYTPQPSSFNNATAEVNITNYWDNLDDYNTTQMDSGDGDTLNIKQSWLTSFGNSLWSRWFTKSPGLYNDSDTVYFNSSWMNETIDIILLGNYWFFTEESLVYGTSQGSLSETQQYDDYDSISYNLTEEVPNGFEYYANTSANVSTDVNKICIRYKSVGEDFAVSLWSISLNDWEGYMTLSEDIIFNWNCKDIRDSLDHIVDDKILMRIIDVGSASVQHKLYIDAMYVSSGYTPRVGNEVDPIFSPWLLNPIFEHNINATNINYTSTGYVNATHFGDGSQLTGLDFAKYQFTNNNFNGSGAINTTGNITASYGFFSWLGSIVNRITKLWAVDIDVNGTIQMNQGNITNVSYLCNTTNSCFTLTELNTTGGTNGGDGTGGWINTSTETNTSLNVNINQNLSVYGYLLKGIFPTNYTSFIDAPASSIADNPCWVVANGSLQKGFNPPDLRDRFIVGAGNLYSLDARSGSATHAHYFASGDHRHGPSSTARGGSSNLPEMWVADPSEYESVTGTTDAGSTLPPYHALTPIMWIC